MTSPNDKIQVNKLLTSTINVRNDEICSLPSGFRQIRQLWNVARNIDFSVTRKAKSSQTLQDLHSTAEEMRIKPAIAAMHSPHSLVRFVY